jgi:hypothetical protein
LVVSYSPVTLFSLRMSTATSSGGKTLLVPTPYAVKIALVDAAIRAEDVAAGERVLQMVKGREIRFRPPKHTIVNNTFVRILREREMKAKKEDTDEYRAKLRQMREAPYQRTIAYREFCAYTGVLDVAIGIEGLSGEEVAWLVLLCAHVNYFGKRGSFMQFSGANETESLPEGFTQPAGDVVDGGRRFGAIQPLDDIGDAMAPDLFDRISTYGAGRVELGKHRVLRPTLLPCRLGRTTRDYTEYTLIES